MREGANSLWDRVRVQRENVQIQTDLTDFQKDQAEDHKPEENLDMKTQDIMFFY